MASLNKVILIGNLTRDPELRYTPSGTALCKFGLAVNEKYKDKESTVFVNIVAWGKTAELTSEYLHKGSQACIDGRLSFSSWDSDSGEKRSKLEVTADRVVFLGGRSEGSGGGGSTQQAPASDGPPADDDVPF
jgi:single-strand DNA-binding protein